MAQQAIPHLVKALSDSEEWVRASAAKALGLMGDSAQQAIPALVKALTDLDSDVSEAATKSLIAIDPEWRRRA